MLRSAVPLLLTAAVLSEPLPAGATGASARYQFPGRPVDLVCSSALAEGRAAGGACLPFGGGDAIRVTDDLRGEHVWFTVCVDNDGNGVCLNEDPRWAPPCADDVYPSATYYWAVREVELFNPVGPVRTGFRPGCPGGRFPGYLVFVCPEVVDTHVLSSPVTGTAEVTSGGTGVGRSGCGADYFGDTPLRYALDDRAALRDGSGVRSSPDGAVTGRDCRAPGSNDPTGIFLQDPNSPMFSSFAGGPWTVAGATSVTVTCVLQYGQQQPQGPDAGFPAVSRTTLGPVGAVAEEKLYTLSPYPVWVCTYVSWTAADGTTRYYARDAAGDLVVLDTGPGGACDVYGNQLLEEPYH